MSRTIIDSNNAPSRDPFVLEQVVHYSVNAGSGVFILNDGVNATAGRALLQESEACFGLTPISSNIEMATENSNAVPTSEYVTSSLVLQTFPSPTANLAKTSQYLSLSKRAGTWISTRSKKFWSALLGCGAIIKYFGEIMIQVQNIYKFICQLFPV